MLAIKYVRIAQYKYYTRNKKLTTQQILNLKEMNQHKLKKGGNKLLEKSSSSSSDVNDKEEEKKLITKNPI